MANLYPVQLVDISSQNTFDAKIEKAKGTKGVIMKAGQGGYTSLPYAYVEQCKKEGLRYSFYWVIDSRYSKDWHMNEIKRTFSNFDFGNMEDGLWWDLEKPIWTMKDDEYWATPYAGTTLIQQVMDEFYAWSGKTGNSYTASGFAEMLGWNTPKFKTSDFGIRLGKQKLWAAQYNSSITKPDLFGTWTNWFLWQYRPEPDYNYYNGTVEQFNLAYPIDNLPPTIPNDPSPIKTHDGVEVYRINRFGCPVTVQVIDQSKVDIWVTNRSDDFQTVLQSVDKNQASGGVNGGGWPYGSSIANEIWKSNEVLIQSTAKDNRPWMGWSKSKKIVFGQGIPSSDIVDAFGFDRYVLQNGVPNPRYATNTIKDARTFSGRKRDGRTVLCVCEGDDYKNYGLTFAEEAKVLMEFDCDTGGNNDGGSSSTCINKVISNTSINFPSDKSMAYVINAILFKGNKIEDGEIIPPTDPEEPPIQGDNMQYKVVKSARYRSLPTTTTNDTGASSVVGETFESSVKQTDTVNPLIIMVQHPNGKWLPLGIGTIIYTEAVAVVPTPITGEVNVNVNISTTGVITVTANGEIYKKQ